MGELACRQLALDFGAGQESLTPLGLPNGVNGDGQGIVRGELADLIDETAVNKLIRDIGGMIIKDEEYAAGQWVGIAVLGNFSHGQQRMTGYQYLADGKFAPAVSL